MPSFEEVMTRSDSLSLSSYSSWLLPPPALVALYPVPITNWPVVRARRRRCKLESCWTRRPVVMISLSAEEREEEDCREAISIHDPEVG